MAHCPDSFLQMLATTRETFLQSAAPPTSDTEKAHFDQAVRSIVMAQFMRQKEQEHEAATAAAAAMAASAVDALEERSSDGLLAVPSTRWAKTCGISKWQSRKMCRDTVPKWLKQRPRSRRKLSATQKHKMRAGKVQSRRRKEDAQMDADTKLAIALSLSSTHVAARTAGVAIKPTCV